MLVLLVGEIDLSIGAVSGLCAVIMAVAQSYLGLSAGPSIAAALAGGLMIGLAQGAVVVFFRVPSFMITLAGLMVWLGLQHILLGGHLGELEVEDPFLRAIASTFMPSWLSWVLVITVLAVVFLPFVLSRSRRLMSTAPSRVLGRNALYLLILAAVVTTLDQHSGVPFLLVLLLALTAVLTVITEYTPLGVHMFAIGGNAESARRAGINVAGVRIAMFSLCSTLAAVAGVVSASRQLAVDDTTGGGTLALDAIAAAVIGGTSLFGGRGRALGALLGAVVVAGVANGLDLLGLSGAFKSIATGLMLFFAVCLDSTMRRYRRR
jgi:D-xylose transport system permease protein